MKVLSFMVALGLVAGRWGDRLHERLCPARRAVQSPLSGINTDCTFEITGWHFGSVVACRPFERSCLEVTLQRPGRIAGDRAGALAAIPFPPVSAEAIRTSCGGGSVSSSLWVAGFGEALGAASLDGLIAERRDIAQG